MKKDIPRWIENPAWIKMRDADTRCQSCGGKGRIPTFFSGALFGSTGCPNCWGTGKREVKPPKVGVEREA